MLEPVILIASPTSACESRAASIVTTSNLCFLHAKPEHVAISEAINRVSRHGHGTTINSGPTACWECTGCLPRGCCFCTDLMASCWKHKHIQQRNKLFLQCGSTLYTKQTNKPMEIHTATTYIKFRSTSGVLPAVWKSENPMEGEMRSLKINGLEL